MPKAIKHIRAGLLNLEIIGTVPEPGAGPRRAAAAGEAQMDDLFGD